MSLEASPEVMRYLNGGRPVPEEGMTHSDFLTPRGTESEVLAAHESATGRFVGWFCIFDDGFHKGLHTAELGYRLSRWAWGQGFATEGAKGLLRNNLNKLSGANAIIPLAVELITFDFD